jgi:hypothetical protein
MLMKVYLLPESDWWRSLTVKDKKSLSDYEEFAAERGLKVENDLVFFGVDSKAANDFYIEAKDAGFDVFKGVSKPGCYENPDELLKMPKRWFVRLIPEKDQP